jgi:hypothetical protein
MTDTQKSNQNYNHSRISMKSQIGHNSQWKIAMWLKMTLNSRLWIDYSQVTTQCLVLTMVMQLKMVIDYG